MIKAISMRSFASRPAVPKAGDSYFDNQREQVMRWDGAKWIAYNEPATKTTPEFQTGAEAMRRQVCIWLQAQANAEQKLGRDSAAFIEAHNAVLHMDAPEEVRL